MEFKGTPGPWVMSGELCLVGDPMTKIGQHMLYCASCKSPEFIGNVFTVQSADHVDNGVSREEAKANAKLLCAAPDLLALVQRVASLNENAGEIGAGMLMQLVTDARAIVQKATE